LWGYGDDDETERLAIHYSETADTSDRMSQVIKKFDPLGSKPRTQVSNARLKLSDRAGCVPLSH
jgi:hypothetical protein